MNADIMTAVSRIVFYGATWGSVAAVAMGQSGHTRDERMTAAELRRLETDVSRERSRGVLHIIEQRHGRQQRFASLGLTPSTATSIASAMKLPVEKTSVPPVCSVPVCSMEEAEAPSVPVVEHGQYALPLGNVLQLRTTAPAECPLTLQHAHAA